MKIELIGSLAQMGTDFAHKAEGGFKIIFDIPETEKENAKQLLDMTQKILKITVEVEE